MLDKIDDYLKENINKRLCELLGIEYVLEWMGPNGTVRIYENFFTEKGRIALLKRMLEQNVNWLDFQEKYISRGNSISLDLLLDDTGVLARAALKFLEDKNKG